LELLPSTAAITCTGFARRSCSAKSGGIASTTLAAPRSSSPSASLTPLQWALMRK